MTHPIVCENDIYQIMRTGPPRPINHFDLFYGKIKGASLYNDQAVPRRSNKLVPVFGDYTWSQSYEYRKKKRQEVLNSNRYRKNLRSGIGYFMK